MLTGTLVPWQKSRHKYRRGLMTQKHRDLELRETYAMDPCLKNLRSGHEAEDESLIACRVDPK
ncbi:hypothetical protein Mapa_011764 [Marchantia paleacea]|nr:hypothetical protein Mapa_011764 [Marchantia paleacea]